MIDLFSKRIQQQEEEEKQQNGSNTTKYDDMIMRITPPLWKVPISDCFILDTDIDPKKQIRRCEAIQIGWRWFRLSYAKKAGLPFNEQPVRAQAPLLVVSLQDLSAVHNVLSERIARERLRKLSHGVRSSCGASSSSGVTGSESGSRESRISSYQT